MRKFKHIKEVDNWEVLTPNGYKPVSKAMLTEPYDEYKLTTVSDKTLHAADDHIVILEDGSECFMRDLEAGMRVKCEKETEIVEHCVPTGLTHDMYDFEVPDGNVYYTDGILSHNTTTSAAYLLHQAITRPNITIAILANKGSTAAEILERIKFAYENLPWFLQVGVKTWNKSYIELGNGSKIITAATSSSSIRGKSINILFLDEFGFVENQVEFYTSTYPVISAGKTTQVIITSTPHGLDLFYRLWTDAEEGRNKFKTIGYDWTVVPGRDEKWKEETLANTSPVQFAQEYECVGGDTIVTIKFDRIDDEFDISIEQLFKIKKCSRYGCVYKVNREDGKSYIGTTVNLPKRINTHKNHKRFSVYGIKSVDVLYEGNYAECEFLEEYFIEKYDTYNNGLNLTRDGKGLSGDCNFSTFEHKFSEETKHKMKISARIRALRDKISGVRHRAHSEESKRKMSMQRRGKAQYTILPEHKKKALIDEYNQWLKTIEYIPREIFLKYVKETQKELINELKILEMILPSGHSIITALPRIFVDMNNISERYSEIKTARIIQILRCIKND